jgi:hypothetical protein
MLKRKKKKEKKLPILGFEPTPLSFNAVDSDSSLFEYSSKWRYALDVYYLKENLFFYSVFYYRYENTYLSAKWFKS